MASPYFEYLEVRQGIDYSKGYPSVAKTKTGSPAYKIMKHVVKVPKSPSLARGVASRGAPVSAALSDGAAPAIATFLSTATPIMGELAKIIPSILDEFVKVVASGIEDGLKEIASTKVFKD